MHGFEYLVKALDGEQQVMHLVHLDRSAQDLVEHEWTHLATFVEHVGALAVGADQSTAVHLYLAVLSNESELHGIPEDAPDPFQNRLIGNARADLAVVGKKIGKYRVRVHGYMAEDIVKDVGFGRVFERVAATQPGGGGEAACGQHFERRPVRA